MATKSSGPKENKTTVVATIEKKKFNPQTGEKESKAFDCTFSPGDWRNFQKTGWRQGWFLIEVKEAPKGLDLFYRNPGEK